MAHWGPDKQTLATHAQAAMNELSKETKQQLKLFKFGRAIPL